MSGTILTVTFVGNHRDPRSAACGDHGARGGQGVPAKGVPAKGVQRQGVPARACGARYPSSIGMWTPRSRATSIARS